MVDHEDRSVADKFSVSRLRRSMRGSNAAVPSSVHGAPQVPPGCCREGPSWACCMLAASPFWMVQLCPDRCKGVAVEACLLGSCQCSTSPHYCISVNTSCCSTSVVHTSHLLLLLRMRRRAGRRWAA